MAIATKAKARKWRQSLKRQVVDPDYIKLRRETSGSENPNTGQWTEGAVIDTPIIAVLVEYDSSLIDGTKILAGDKQVIASYDCGYQQGDSLVIGGDNYMIVDVNDINPSGVTQVFEFQVRSA